MNQSASDEETMARLAAGHDPALAELMGRWEGPIWCFIDRMCGNSAGTDDVYQEVWTRLYQYRKRYRPGRPFRSYLFAIAVNCCRTALKRGAQGRGMFISLGDVPARASGETGPDETLVEAEQRQRLLDAVRRLPDQQRAVVLLYLLYHTDYGKIAQVTGKSAGTVRSHMHHALVRLRAALTKVRAAEEGKVDHERQLH